VNDEDSDSLMLLRAVRNGYRHLLKSGVTTMREAGARRRVAFDLKDGISAGLFRGFPTVLACGRTITITGGHFYFCGEEADGATACRTAVRRLVKEGADFIKAMSSGGGTYITDNRRASFTLKELKAIVDEAHRHGKATTTHAIATQSIANAVDAGFDCIEHYEFVELDYTRRFDPRLGERMIEKGIWLSPTIQTGYRNQERLRLLKQERPLTPTEEENLTYYAWKQEGQLYVTGKLVDMGAHRFLMGTDAISEFGDYAIGLRLLVDAGLSNRHALQAATRNCAEAFGLMDDFGTLEPGKLADVTVVKGNPLQNIRAMNEVVQVVKAGYALPMCGLELFPHGPGAAQVFPKRRRHDPQVIRLQDRAV
jgi:imidazolonepropionase-like amidohydrolase